MQRLMIFAASAVLAAPALAAEFTLTPSPLSTGSVMIPFSAKDSFGQPSAPVLDAFPGEPRGQNVEFQIQGAESASGSMPGLTITATRSPFPAPGTVFSR